MAFPTTRARGSHGLNLRDGAATRSLGWRLTRRLRAPGCRAASGGHHPRVIRASEGGLDAPGEGGLLGHSGSSHLSRSPRRTTHLRAMRSTDSSSVRALNRAGGIRRDSGRTTARVRTMRPVCKSVVPLCVRDWTLERVRAKDEERFRDLRPRHLLRRLAGPGTMFLPTRINPEKPGKTRFPGR